MMANLHRGHDAAGFFAVEGKKTALVKKDMPADEFIEKELSKYRLGQPHIVGIHTRAATQGPKEENENNHPVRWGNVLVTHNGMISNDREIKRSMKKQPDLVPEVDTAAIAAVLHEVAEDPFKDFDAIMSALPRLKGSFAFHAVWQTKPGYSLFVRGNSSPITCTYEEGLFVYSSERDGVESLQKLLGGSALIRTFDTRAVLLLHNGTPVRWGEIDDAYGGNELIVRLRPDGEKWFDTTRTTFYAAQDRPWCIGDDTDKTLIYDREKDEATGTPGDFLDLFGTNVVMEKRRPIAHTQPAATLAEADRIWRFSKDSGQSDTFSAWYGDVEVLVDEHGNLVDIFNWKDEFERFEKIPYKPKARPKMTLEQWWPKKTTISHHNPLAGGWHRTPTSTPGPISSRTGGNSVTVSTQKTRGGREDGLPLALFDRGTFMDQNGARFVMRNKRDNSIPFLANERCAAHNQWLVNHTHAAECEFVQIATLAALNRADSVPTLMIMVNGGVTLETKNRYPSMSECTEGAHAWRTHLTLQVPIRDLIRVHLPLEDDCMRCNVYRRITKWTPAVADYFKNHKKDAQPKEAAPVGTF